MKKKLAWLLVGTMVFGTTLLGGCGKKVTAQSLVEEMNAKLENTKSYEAAMDMGMSMNVEAEGVGMDIDLSMAGNTETVMDPMITHMDMTMDMSLLGLSMDMDMYLQIDGEQPVSDDMNLNNITVNVGDPANLKLAEKTETLDGGEAYVITGTISGAELQDVLASAESMMEGLGEVDLTSMQADMTLWIYKDTGYPASMEVVMSGDGISTEADGVTIRVTELSVVTDYIGFDTIDTIEIPDEALAASEIDANGMIIE